jgi:prephenate dehydrogenase
MTAVPTSVSVFGPGLMGGSLLMALRQREPEIKLGVWARRAAAVDELKLRKLADFGGTNAAAVAADSQMIVLCLPVDHLEKVAAEIKDVLPRDAWVTDVGSVKKSVVETLEKLFGRGGSFVGSHPMCGSEEAGLQAARADLYQGALCVITPTPDSNPQALRAVTDLWRRVGARTIEMTPSEHDRAAAVVSHVPHVAAALLVELVRAENPSFRDLCAGGFRDTTRIASGSPDLWAGILSSNREEVLAALRKLTAAATRIEGALQSNDTDALRAFLAQAAQHRSEILSQS